MVNCSCEFPFFLCFFYTYTIKGKLFLSSKKHPLGEKKETIQDLS
ncbi:hypothetical protein PNI0446_02426 [Streptococcus pneumoniae PNI0446]|nr:hypothetical protein PNI0446_02426 [Streptococcus pneumoniae PNI0446]